MCLEKVDGGHVNLKAIHAVADPRSRASLLSHAVSDAQPVDLLLSGA